MIEQFFPVTGVALDRNREEDILEEIKAQHLDLNWQPSFEDLNDIVTITQVSDNKFESVLGDGLVF